MKDPVEGTAQVVSATMPTRNAVTFTGTLELVVSADGVPATAVSHTNTFARDSHWPMAGQEIPVTVDRADPQQIKIHWDQVRSYKKAGHDAAQQIATAMNADQPRPASGGSDQPGLAGLSEEQTARLSQALGGLGISGLGSAQVIDLTGHDAPAAPTVSADPIAQLEKLAALRSSGALTDAEFEQQKKRILGQ
jgi:hypothetical protein